MTPSLHDIKEKIKPKKNRRKQERRKVYDLDYFLNGGNERRRRSRERRNKK